MLPCSSCCKHFVAVSRSWLTDSRDEKNCSWVMCCCVSSWSATNMDILHIFTRRIPRHLGKIEYARNIHHWRWIYLLTLLNLHLWFQMFSGNLSLDAASSLFGLKLYCPLYFQQDTSSVIISGKEGIIKFQLLKWVASYLEMVFMKKFTVIIQKLLIFVCFIFPNLHHFLLTLFRHFPHCGTMNLLTTIL